MDASPTALPSIKLEIQGKLYTVPLHYQAGHVLTEAEAVALNKLRCDNMRNIFAKTVKEAPPDTDLDAAFASFEEAYEFTKTVAKTALDPVERAAHIIATDLANQLLRKQNIPKHSLKDGAFDTIVLRILNEQPGIMEEARDRVAAAERLAIGLKIG